VNDNLFNVEDQVVVVSGASRGIGEAIARGFVARGAKVVITGRDPKTLETTSAELSKGKHPVRGMVCDVSQIASIEPFVRQVLVEYGHIDTLVNVAGVNRRKQAETITEEDFDFIMDINFKGAFFLSQAVGRRMIERGKGSQINIGSLNNHSPLPWVLPYASSKAAVVHMTRVLAMEWGPRGVRVNAIAPGFILTDLSKKLWSHPVMQAWGPKNTPLKRLGDPDDMIGSAIFLASEASAFMTGQTLFVDGGFTAGLRWPIDEAV